MSLTIESSLDSGIEEADGAYHEDLTESSLLEIARFLKLKDRAKYERINKTCSKVCKKLWQGQVSLAFVDDYPKYIRICQNPRHSVYKSNFIIVKNIHDRIKLLQKCPNIKLLLWDGKSAKGQLSDFYNNGKHKLEHIEGVEDGEFEDVDVIPSLTCVRPTKTVNHILELSTVSRLAIPSTRGYQINSDIFRAIREHGSHIETLVLPGINEETANELVDLCSDLNNIKSLRAWSNNFNEITIKKLPPQEYIVWRQEFDEKLFIDLFKRCSSFVKKVRIGNPVPLVAFEIIVKYCSELEDLDIAASSFLKGINEHIKKLIELKTLKVHEEFATGAPVTFPDEIVAIITKAQHLRTIDINLTNLAPTTFSTDAINALYEKAKSRKGYFYLRCNKNDFKTWLQATKPHIDSKTIPTNLIVNDKSLAAYV